MLDSGTLVEVPMRHLLQRDETSIVAGGTLQHTGTRTQTNQALAFLFVVE